ncbi:MAG: hypothetical protein L6Q93_11110 [Phycisphaerae bacterium]|nr:hypothetical protein [Phycisphaerae bacterium]
MSNTPDLAHPRFLGPPALARGWDAFVARYSENGWLGVNVENAARLNQLAFDPKGAQELLSLQDTDPQAYRRIRSGIEDAARALSKETQHPEMRPLHRAVVAALITQWTDLKRRHGLHPPPQRAKSDGVGVATARDIRDRYHALLRSPEGSLLTGTLLLAEDALIAAETRRVTRRLASRVREDDVRPIAHDLALRSLYKFDPARTDDFNAFLVGGMKQYLAGQVLFTLLGARRSTTECQLAEESAETLTDDRTSDLLEELAQVDAGQHVRRVVDRLPPNEREVLRLRFGLTDDRICHSLTDISQQLGCTKQNVQQTQRRGLERCRRWCRELDDSLTGHDRPPTGPGRDR